MKLETTEDILQWVSTCSRTGCGCCAEEDSPEDIVEAARLALGQRVLRIAEWSATRESCYAPDVRAMFESVLENAEAKEGGE